LLSVGAGADSEITVRLGQSELLKKNIRHRGVIMLAGVNEGLENSGEGQGTQNGRSLHEVGASAYDVEDSHELGQRRIVFGIEVRGQSIRLGR
jgi:hypothetical protein